MTTGLLLSAGALALIAAVSSPDTDAVSPTPSGTMLWRETFEGLIDWTDPGGHASPEISQVFSVRQEGGLTLLRAYHDATHSSSPGAVHYGKAFPRARIPLDQVGSLRWRWRVRAHPNVKNDPWRDMALSVYVVIKAPSLFSRGRGFKFGWLSQEGRSDSRQHGLLQVPVRHSGLRDEWQAEEVDLCAAYRRTYGPCEGEHILYIGVVTDADGTKSIAAGDYADFELLGAARSRIR